MANAVKVTLGPKGRNVALDKKWGAPTITHDGVTVAKEIELEGPLENMGAQLLKEAATKTNDVAGDGTTTATVLAQMIVTEGLKNVAAGAPMLIRTALPGRRTPWSPARYGSGHRPRSPAWAISANDKMAARSRGDGEGRQTASSPVEETEAGAEYVEYAVRPGPSRYFVTDGADGSDLENP
jgi:hypothetical protein